MYLPAHSWRDLGSGAATVCSTRSLNILGYVIRHFEVGLPQPPSALANDVFCRTGCSKLHSTEWVSRMIGRGSPSSIIMPYRLNSAK